MCARLLLIYWARIRYHVVLALLQQSLRLLPVAENTKTPAERAFDFAGLPRGYRKRWSVRRCKGVSEDPSHKVRCSDQRWEGCGIDTAWWAVLVAPRWLGGEARAETRMVTLIQRVR
jgi:hypothetical protein